jgi:3-phenylpropionate/cinnamic acid dioxygenase small subunit
MEDGNEGWKVWLKRQREGLSAAHGRRVASTSQIWAPSQSHLEERGRVETEKEESTVPAKRTLGKRVSAVWGKGLQRADERFNILTRSISSIN